VLVGSDTTDVTNKKVYHDFGPVLANGLRFANGRAVEVEYPV